MSEFSVMACHFLFYFVNLALVSHLISDYCFSLKFILEIIWCHFCKHWLGPFCVFYFHHLGFLPYSCEFL